MCLHSILYDSVVLRVQTHKIYLIYLIMYIFDSGFICTICIVIQHLNIHVNDNFVYTHSYGIHIIHNFSPR